MTLVGGIRVRMLRESLYRYIYDGLAGLGWFNEDRRHAPVHFIAEPFDRDVQIPPNTLTLSLEDSDDWETGLGEISVEERLSFWVDFYAEDDAIGIELTYDVKDIVAGRHQTVALDHPRFPIYDYRQATPGIVAWADVENINVGKARDFPKPWLKHWHAVSFDVLDTYGPEGN